MTLQSSGVISMSDVNIELSYSSTAVITLDDAAVRTLFGIASGAISLSDGYGKGRPQNTVAPALSGYSTVGYTLYTTNGTWTNSPTSYTYAWYRSNGVLVGTGSNYSTVSADVGYTIRCLVTATNAYGSTSAYSNYSATCYVVPTNSVAPTTNVGTSVVTVGSAISISSYGTWTGSPTSYGVYWYRSDGTYLSSATSYTTVSADIGKTIRALVTAYNSNDAGSPGPAYTAYTGTVGAAPTNSVAPAVSGSTTVGSTLTTTNGTWNNTPTSYTYQWYRGASTAISGATNSTYVTASADVGSQIRCLVTATNAYGSGTAYSNYTVAITQSKPTSVEYLVVAGGGAGGYGPYSTTTSTGGGGGAGQVLTGTLSVTSGTTYTVTVGGGATATQTNTNAPNGSNSVFATVTSRGGGSGGGADTSNFAGRPGNAGGNGGGGGGRSGAGGSSNSTPTGYAGGNGGTGGANSDGSGGGGGAGAAGTAGSGPGGPGGSGVSSSISGAATTYAGGGGGGSEQSTGGAGGSGGGGRGGFGSNGALSIAGTTNSGSGGGGSGSQGRVGADGAGTPSTTPSSGGSGIIIIRYSNIYANVASTTGTPTFTDTGGYKIYIWTGSGSVTI